MIQEQLKYLEFQAQQMANADTGRLGVDVQKTDEEIAAVAGGGGGGSPGGFALPGGGSPAFAGPTAGKPGGFALPGGGM